MFFTQVNHYSTCFEEYLKNAKTKSMSTLARHHGLGTDELMTDALLKNNKEFIQFVYAYAQYLVPGRVACTAYASAVAAVAESLGIAYEVYSGYCMPRCITSFDSETKRFSDQRANGVEHPVIANHIYIVINGVTYEYFNGNTSNIEHFDVVKVR